MPTNTETLNRQLYQLLSKYKPKPLDAEGKATPVPDEADIFKFQFTKDGEDYGTVYVTLDEDRVLTVYFGDDVTDSPDDRTPGVDYDDTWSGLLHQLSSFRMTRGLKGFDTKNKDQVNDAMARRKHMRNKDKIAEGYYPMGKKASYSDAVPSVKIVIEHSRVIEEGEQRYRNINRIFLENQLGERYLLDTKKPGIARVYARHIAEGGKVNDDRWNHIGNLCEEYQKMAGFVRATRNGQFNESAQALVNEGLEHYASLRESLSRMTGKRGYNAYFESWTPALMETEGEETNLNELFVQETLDPRIESVMPILSRIHKKVAESVIDKEMNKLAEWADSLSEAEGESIQSNNPIGIPEEELEEGFMDTIKKGYNKAVNTLGNIGIMPPELLSPRRDANGNWNKRTNEPRNNFIFWIEQNPGLEPHQAELLASFDKWVDDGNSDRDAGKQAVEMWKQKMKATKQSVSEPMRTPSMTEEEMDESALQAYLGNKKYGEKGMDALRKAGREHAGKEKMQNIRAKYSKDEEVSEEVDTGEYDARKSTHKGHPTPEQEKSFREKVQAYGKELEKRQKEKEVDEGLDANQKRVGQLGPTEKVKNNNIGKLVGANENFINQADQAVTTEDEMDEGTHTQYDRDLNPNDYERPPTDWSVDPIEAGTDRIHQKISSMLKKLSKPEDKPLDKNKTSLGSTVLDEMDKSQTPPGRDGDPRPGPDKEAKTISKEKMVNHALDTLTKSMDKAHDKKDVKEGQEDLDAILRIIRK